MSPLRERASSASAAALVPAFASAAADPLTTVQSDVSDRLYESKAGATLLRSLLKDARTQMEQFRADVTSALRQVAQTPRGLRQGPEK